MAWLTAFLQPRLRGLNKVRTSLCQSTAKKICDGLTGRSASKTRAVVSGRLKARSKTGAQYSMQRRLALRVRHWTPARRGRLRHRLFNIMRYYLGLAPS